MEKRKRKKEDPAKVLARQIKFQKAHIVQLSIKLNDNTDADIIDFLDTLDNKRGYLLDLIRADMAKRNGGTTMEKYWYAVMRDHEDDDWGTGSYDLDEAKELCRKYPEGYIAVIQEGANPICIREIDQEDF